ncbi:hypothetical protein [Blastopirellula retiformator]|uniref:Uncharacterized protein n=1 Tax=Blastopirellula retiformator TaxID=2527970 RepID=A0A5C5V4X1_9BACT|nr:hypothetical protein [Blastopirellula retiformator]TWT32782.1 hypothetical protein Enr8_25880 [Blastopirellula retiformator]
MNAVAVVVCMFALAGDAKETIPHTRDLFNVIDNTYSIRNIQQIEVSADGTTLQTLTVEEEKQDAPPTKKVVRVKVRSDGQKSFEILGEYRLRVVAIPEASHLLLAGFESTSKDPYYGKSEHLLRYCFCVLIDTDRNIVVPLDDPKQRLFLEKEQVEEVHAICEGIWSYYLDRIAEQESDAPFYSEFQAFRGQFVKLPPFETKVKVAFFADLESGEAIGVPQEVSTWRCVAGMAVRVEIAAEGRKNVFGGQIEMQPLLSTTIAKPAEEYFPQPKYVSPITTQRLPSPR